MVLVGDPRRELDRLAEPFAEAPFDLATEPLDAPLVDEVLEASPLAILTVAEVALDGDDRLGDVDHSLWSDPPQRRGEPRIGVVRAGVALSEAAAD